MHSRGKRCFRLEATPRCGQVIHRREPTALKNALMRPKGSPLVITVLAFTGLSVKAMVVGAGRRGSRRDECGLCDERRS